MTTSVALCTYNGASYIQEQIESILNQTMPVDEIVICDDGSTDNTLQIVNKLQRSATIDIRIYKNEGKLGVSNNFQKAINLCQGDIIFLSDQDDIWMPEKVEKISNYFDEHSDIEVVFSDAILIDANGVPIKSRKKKLWDYTFHTSYRRLFDNGCEWECFLEGNVATGATMAVRKAYCDRITFIKLCDNIILHDYAICLIASRDNVLGYVDKPLTKYRLYDNQTCGISDKSPFYSVDEQIYIIDRVSNLLLCSNKMRKRKDFVRFRIKNANRFWGGGVLLLKTHKYYKFYKKEAFHILFHDIERWKELLLNRFLFSSERNSIN